MTKEFTTKNYRIVFTFTPGFSRNDGFSAVLGIFTGYSQISRYFSVTVGLIIFSMTVQALKRGGDSPYIFYNRRK